MFVCMRVRALEYTEDMSACEMRQGRGIWRQPHTSHAVARISHPHVNDKVDSVLAGGFDLYPSYIDIPGLHGAVPCPAKLHMHTLQQGLQAPRASSTAQSNSYVSHCTGLDDSGY